MRSFVISQNANYRNTFARSQSARMQACEWDDNDRLVPLRSWSYIILRGLICSIPLAVVLYLCFTL